MSLSVNRVNGINGNQTEWTQPETVQEKVEASPMQEQIAVPQSPSVAASDHLVTSLKKAIGQKLNLERRSSSVQWGTLSRQRAVERNSIDAPPFDLEQLRVVVREFTESQ